MTYRDDMAKRPNYALSEDWTTVAVTPLTAGWVNVFRDDDGTLQRDPSPGLLLQENRKDFHSYDVTAPDGTVTRKMETDFFDPPYDTRAVFAMTSEGVVQPASDMSNYLWSEYGPMPEPELTPGGWRKP